MRSVVVWSPSSPAELSPQQRALVASPPSITTAQPPKAADICETPLAGSPSTGTADVWTVDRGLPSPVICPQQSACRSVVTAQPVTVPADRL